MNIVITSIEAILVDISTHVRNQTLISGWIVNYNVTYPIFLTGKIKIDTVSFSPQYNDLVDLIEESLRNAIT